MNFKGASWLSRAGLLIVLGSIPLSGNAAEEQTFTDRPFTIHPTLVGSWKSDFDVPGFGGTNLTFLLSFTSDHILIETDTPAAISFLGQSASLGNAHGAWKPTRNGGFQFTYVKEIYSATVGNSIAIGQTKLDATGAVSADGNHLQITSVTFAVSDASGNVLATGSGTATANRIVVDDTN
jgi:hypothetical protein